MHKVRHIVLGAMATLAISAMIASTASADEFHAESAPVTLTGAQEKHLEGGVERNDRFTTDGGVTECTTITYRGTQVASTATTMTLTPTYSGCAFAGLSSVIDMNECDYLFHLNAGLTTGTTDIVCPSGREITKTVGPAATLRCITHIPPQQGIGGVTYTNLGAGSTREITIAMNLANIHYSQTAGSGAGACATADNTTNGTYIGALKVTGETDPSGAAHIGIWVE